MSLDVDRAYLGAQQSLILSLQVNFEAQHQYS